MRGPAPIALAALAACSSQAPPATAAFHEPTAVAAFSGWTPERPRTASLLPQPYLAVASGRSDELRLLDLATHKPVMSPGFAYPLSVPTLPRPTYLAASSLRDGGPDLLAVAGVGALVDVVSTWGDGTDPVAGGNRVVARYDLSAVAGTGAEILSMIATPVPGAPAGNPAVAPAVPGKAWLILGFSGALGGPSFTPGGTLVVLEFARGPLGSVVLSGPPRVKALGFDPVSAAVSPDLFHLYLATPDPIADNPAPPTGPRQVYGVAEVTMSGGIAAPWPVRGLDAMAPTTLVASAMLGERLPTSPDFFGPPALRVYAALDSGSCGPLWRVACGIAVLDPALGGMAADLAPPGPVVPAQTYRAPMLVPAVPLTLSVAMPPAAGPLQCIADNDPCNVPAPPAPLSPNRQPLMQLVANGARWTTGVAAVGAGDGRTYLLDLGRSGPASDVSLLNSDVTRAQVSSAISLAPLRPDGSAARAALGLYKQYPVGSEEFTSDATKMLKAVVITPGFTRGESWSLVWQGFLPGLQGKSFVLGFNPLDGSLYLAFQTALGAQWDVGAYVRDTRLGIHAADTWPLGDVVQFSLPADQFGAAGNPCALSGNTRYEAVIASILPPDPVKYPGGALKLVLPAGPSTDPFSLLCLRNWLDPTVPPGPSVPSLLTGADGGVRASGLVLSGSSSGYAGRPPLLTQDDVLTGVAATKRFNFAWADESTLGPLSEAWWIARKARRFFYANDAYFPAANGGKYPETNGNPMTPGPVLGFIAGPMCADQPVAGQQGICPPTRLGDLQRDSTLQLATSAGVSPSSRGPVPSSLPSSSIAFDRSLLPDGGGVGTVFYVAYRQDEVLIAVPGQTPNISSTVR